MIKGRNRTRVAKGVDFRHQPLRGLFKFCAQFGVGNDADGAGESRHIKGFARGDLCDRARFDFFPERRRDRMLHVVIEHEIAMDFVGHQYQIMFRAKLGDLDQFITRPHAAYGIVRAA